MNINIFRFAGDMTSKVMTKARCSVGTMTAIAAAARLVTNTDKHRFLLN